MPSLRLRSLSVLLAAGAFSVGCSEEASRAQDLGRSFFFADRIEEATRELDETAFRSFRKDGSLVSHVTMDEREYRVSLVPPVPSRLSYDVVGPEGGMLEFDIGVSALGAESASAPVTFGVTIVSRDGSERTVFEETVRRRFANQWFRRRVDLAKYAGRKVTVRFETRLHETPFTGPGSGEYLQVASRSMMPAWGHPVLSGSRPQGDRPPLLLISIDCLRADHVSAYGHEAPTTPHLDALADEGLLFENVASVSTWTLPTHMSMLTGLMPTEHGLRRDRKKSPSVPYLPEILAREGYETVGVVSGLYLGPTFGYEEGFHLYRTLFDEPAETLVDAARELLLTEGDRPRFLFLHFFDAHWPYLPEPEYLEQVGGRPAEISAPLSKVGSAEPPSGPEEIETLKRLYDAEIAYVDAELGRLFAALKGAGLYDRALIVVTSDHGEAFYEHALWQHSEVIYNEVTRVPLIVKEPTENAAPPARIENLVSQLNIFPTFLEPLGLESPYAHSGLSALARGTGDFPQSALTEVSWEPTAERGSYMTIAVSDNRFKYVATYSGERGDPGFVSRLQSEELYDLVADAGETENLISGGHGIASRRAEVQEFLEIVRERRGEATGETIVVDEETLEKLRSLGYVQP